MGNISVPVFGASSPQQFIGRLASLQPDPATKMPDPAKVKAFADANPEVLLQGKHFASQPVPASFGSVNYWGVHAFGFVNASGSKQFGKWMFEPVGGLQGVSDDEAKAKGPSFPVRRPAPAREGRQGRVQLQPRTGRARRQDRQRHGAAAGGPRRREIEEMIQSDRDEVRRSWEWRKTTVVDNLPSPFIEAEWSRAQERFGERVCEINQRIQNYNLEVPSPRFQLRSMSFESELELTISPPSDTLSGG